MKKMLKNITLPRLYILTKVNFVVSKLKVPMKLGKEVRQAFFFGGQSSLIDTLSPPGVLKRHKTAINI